MMMALLWHNHCVCTGNTVVFCFASTCSCNTLETMIQTPTHWTQSRDRELEVGCGVWTVGCGGKKVVGAEYPTVARRGFASSYPLRTRSWKYIDYFPDLEGGTWDGALLTVYRKTNIEFSKRSKAVCLVWPVGSDSFLCSPSTAGAKLPGPWHTSQRGE